MWTISNLRPPLWCQCAGSAVPSSQFLGTIMKAEEHTIAESKPATTVRLFTSHGGADLTDELAALGIADATSMAQRQLQVVVNVRVKPDSRRYLEEVLAPFSTLTLYVQRGGSEEGTLLLVGAWSELRTCAEEISQLAHPVKALGHEILRQLPLLFPPPYRGLDYPGGTLDFSTKTAVMGILNVTPDSFYDGGRYLDPQAALDRALQMVAEGADIIDIGGQSSRPGSDPVSEAEEAHRVLPVVQAVAQFVPTIISVDTYRADIARAALDAGAHLINDISALRFDPNMLGLVAERQASLILMHMKGSPRNMQLNPTYDAVIDEVYNFLQDRLQTAQAGGMAQERLLIDPGIGFGKGAQHNLEILRKLHHFHTLGQPIVIGTSRKSFIGRILGTDVDERLEGTAATVAVAIAQGASVIRVHDVQAMTRVARMMDAMRQSPLMPLKPDEPTWDAGHPSSTPQ